MTSPPSSDKPSPECASAAVFVVGPTASGKTALAIALALRFDGEVINADSRAFYRGMDIGTAKPTPTERALAPHHLVDVADPDEPLSLGWFLERARAAIEEIGARGRLPVVVGGSGQYVRALLECWQVPRVPPDPALRATLEHRVSSEGLAALVAALQHEDPVAAARVDLNNPRRVIRALELARTPSRPAPTPALRLRPLVLGIAIERAQLYWRIDARVDAMFEAGLVDEVRELIAQGYSCALSSFSAIGYREVCRFLEGDLTLDEARSRTKISTHRLVRTQSAWFRRSDPRIIWLDAGPDVIDEAALRVQAFLASQAGQE